MAMSLWHRNKLKTLFLLSLRREIALYIAPSCPKSPSSVPIHRFYAQDISASKEILRKERSIVLENRDTPASNLCCGRERGEY